ncbi:MAG: hypothetical protein PW788_00795 [Micavibrio sp.]|nr:hypothetical protein [Micavibrio sp.]
MKKLVYIVALSFAIAGCSRMSGTDATYDGISKTAPGYPLSKGTHFSPCQKIDVTGRCIQYVEPSEFCVNPKGMDAKPPIVACPKDKVGNPVPFK